MDSCPSALFIWHCNHLHFLMMSQTLLLFSLLFVQLFSLELYKVFYQGEMDAAVVIDLSELWQGSSSVSDYSIKFHTLANSCGWNEQALWDRFLCGLSETVKDEI